MKRAKALGATKQKRLTRLQVMLSADELAALEDFRFEKRMPSLAAAIREILRRGLTVNGFDVAGKGLRSSEFGVLESEGGNGSGASPTEAGLDKRAKGNGGGDRRSRSSGRSIGGE
jgi:hypothetical protein